MNIQKFDIKAYDSCVKTNKDKADLNPFICRQVLADGTLIEQSSSVSGKEKSYMIVKTPPPSALIKEVKEYYDDGAIKMEYETYVGVLATASPDEASGYGTEKRYDKSGKITKTIDHNEQYSNLKTNLSVLFKQLENEKLLDTLTPKDKMLFQSLWFPEKRIEEITVQDFFKKVTSMNKSNPISPMLLNPGDDADRKSLSIDFEEGKWYVVKDLYPFGLINITIDAATGAILKKEYERRRDHRLCGEGGV